MLSTLISFQNLIFHTLLSLSLFLILTTFNLPTLFLQGLYTYIHPENLSTDQSNPNPNPKPPIRRSRSKSTFEFDESNAQIYRLRLIDSHIQSRLYFPQFKSTFISSTLALSNLLLHAFLSPSQPFIPILLGFYAISTSSIFLAKSSFEKSASKRSDRHLSILFAFLGFGSSISIPSVFDSANGIARISIAVFAGFLSGFLFFPSSKIARSFWIGTDQLRWNLSVISCGIVNRMILYANFLMIVFASLLWINPVAEVLVKKTDRSEFLRFRVWCLMISGILQILTVRPNLQMNLNEAVLSWYQRLHSSKVPDLDFSRAKIFLHNYYLCLAVLQFFVPPVLVLLFLGLSLIEGNLFDGFPLIGCFAHCSSFVKDVCLFMAWWIVFVSCVFVSSNLALYRCGILLIS